METELYRSPDDVVLVTSSRLVAGAVTYPIAQITSVEAIRLPEDQTGGTLVVALGLALLAVAAFCGSAKDAGSSLPPYLIGAVGIAAVVIGVWSVSKSQPSYAVCITTASGEAHAYVSLDGEVVTSVAEAVTQAMVARS